MITVFKYPIPNDDEFSLRMPEGAKILHVAVQVDEPQMWAEVDTEKDSVSRDFRIFGTGHPIESEVDLAYIGTFFSAEGLLVWHLYEKLPWSWELHNKGG